MSSAMAYRRLDTDCPATGVGGGGEDGSRNVPGGTPVDALLMDLNRKRDFKFIATVARLVLYFLRTFWTACSTCVFVLVALYWMYGGLVTLGMCFLGILGMVYQVGDYFLYFPNQPSDSRVFVALPSIYQLPFELVNFKSVDKTKLCAYLIKQPDSISAPTVLYFHGNAGNIGHRLQDASNMFTKMRCNVFLLEYRGYGKSDGKPSESGLYMDAQAALDHLISLPSLDHNKIFVFGRSLGGAVAVDLCIKKANAGKIAGVIIENSFTSIREMAFILMPFKAVKYIPRILYKSKFDSSSKVRNLRLPCLFLSGSADCLVPPKMLQDLYTSCGSAEKSLIVFPNGGHNDTWTCPGYYDSIADFMQKTLLSKETSGNGEVPSGEDYNGSVTVRVSDFV